MKYIVDTHALLWFLANSTRLSLPADAILPDPASNLTIPATAYAEACWIVEHGRLPTLTVATVQGALANDRRCSIYPLEHKVIDRSQQLTTIREMHDRQIVATALVLEDSGEEIALLTHDANITDSGLVPVVW